VSCASVVLHGSGGHRGRDKTRYVPGGDSQLQLPTNYNRLGNAKNMRTRQKTDKSRNMAFAKFLQVERLVVGPLVEALAVLPSELAQLHLIKRVSLNVSPHVQ